MSALGQKRTFERPSEMSALPPRADIEWHDQTAIFECQEYPWNRHEPLSRELSGVVSV